MFDTESTAEVLAFEMRAKYYGGISSPFRKARRQLREERGAWRRSQTGWVGTGHPSTGCTAICCRLVPGTVLPAVECRTTGNVAGELSRRETVGAWSWSCWCSRTGWSSRRIRCTAYRTSGAKKKRNGRKINNKTPQMQIPKRSFKLARLHNRPHVYWPKRGAPSTISVTSKYINNYQNWNFYPFNPANISLEFLRSNI